MESGRYPMNATGAQKRKTPDFSLDGIKLKSNGAGGNRGSA